MHSRSAAAAAVIRRTGPRAHALLAALACLLLGAGAAHAQYKWVEPEGNVAYGDTPPKDATHVEHIDARSVLEAGDPLAGVPFEIRRAARDFPVVLYGRPDCTPCNDARAFLKEHAVPYQERSVTSAEDVEAFHQLGGTNRLPMITIGRQQLHGFDAASWTDVLASAGYPSGIPMPRSWQWPAATPLAPPPAAKTAESGDSR